VRKIICAVFLCCGFGAPLRVPQTVQGAFAGIWTFEAHYNLAAMLQLRGAAQEAVEQYQRALALRPADATVENALGGALLAAHQIPQPIAHLTAAVNARPEYFDAHYNLGIAQAVAGNFPAAAQELATAVKLKPDGAGAEANLGAAFAELGETQKAITHLNRALQLDPANELARENLAALRGTSARP
jgi:tetratricopeptide (TPR) repeat protein